MITREHFRMMLSTKVCLFLLLAGAFQHANGRSPINPPLMPNGNGGTIISCGPNNYTYCYGESWDSTITYQSANTFPIAILFNGGAMETCCDHMSVYDGLNTAAPLIANVNGNLTGLFYASTNTDHALTVHWTSDFSVSCHSGSEALMDWTVSCLDCTAPQATFDIVQDCANFQYSISVNITAMGTDTLIDITNTGGAPALTASAPGVYVVGPFTSGTSNMVTLVNDLNSLCNVHSALLTNPPCPIISCGIDDYTHCYGNNESFYQVFQSASSAPIRIVFNSGSIYQFDGDQLKIYDGLNQFAPVLYQGTGVNGNLSGLTFTSTNLDHALTLGMTSTQFTSCADGGIINGTWHYQVGCYDCTPPVASFTVNTDCVAQSYTVDVNITSVGTDPSIDITNTGGAPPLVATTPGTYTVGPIPVGQGSTVTLVNDSNAFCNVSSAPLINTFCTIISCGPNTYNYCYHNNWDTTLVYQGTSTFPLALQFNSGFLETCCDHVTIYDGLDMTAPILYTGNGDLSGVLAVSTNLNHALTVHFTSDFTVSCQNNNFAELNWTVACLDCTAPQATFGIVQDCANFQYSISVTIAVMGTDTLIDITNTGGAPAITASAPGVYLVGPFTSGTSNMVTLVNNLNSLCNVHSALLINPPCPIISCGIDNYTHCYGNNESFYQVFQSTTNFPVNLQFTSGLIYQFDGDLMTIYDGLNQLAPVLYQGTGVNGNLTGLNFTSTNTDRALTLGMTSTPFTSCGDGGLFNGTWHYWISCLDCTDPAATSVIVPDCIHHSFNVAVNVTDTGNFSTVRIVNSFAHDTLTNVHLGTTMVGPIPLDSSTTITVLHGTNQLCHTTPQTFTYPSDSCITQACAATTFEYCYGNSDTAYFVY